MPQPIPGSWAENVPLPEGWVWHTVPDITSENIPHPVGIVHVDQSNLDMYPVRMNDLREWAEANGVILAVYRSSDVIAGHTYARWPQRFMVRQGTENFSDMGYVLYEWPASFTCPLCEQEHLPYTSLCSERGMYLSCASCGLGAFDPNGHTFVEYNGTVWCTDCLHECESCGERSPDPFCESCDVTIVCHSCGVRYGATPDEVDAGAAPWVSLADPEIEVCHECASRYVCDDCGRYDPRGCRWSDADGVSYCRRCRRSHDMGEGTEEFDDDAEISNAQMRIPTIPGREGIRLCGVEIEGGDGDGGGEELARAFYEAGLSATDAVYGYHGGRDAGFAHVEHDSSVDWEAVIGPLNPASTTDVRKLNQAVRAIRTLVHDEVLTLDLRAGCHIHVEAARTSLDSAYNLSILFAYLEDAIFRIGAARWPIHRSIQNDHYSQPIPKELRKLQFAREHGRDGSRYYALSFQNYFYRMLNDCSCGASRYDSWEDCTCDLGKCTFEFRVFNTTANPRKLHAYLALSQAMVAKAISLGRADVADFPELSFEPKRFKDMTEDTQARMLVEWKERLAWMFQELPLTDDEKDSLLYCVRHSELASVGEDFINGLAPATEPEAEEVTA